MNQYDDDAWLRLGRAVKRARLEAGYSDTKRWAAAVGRSSRMLLGLERGEPVGDGTLDRVAIALKWAQETPYRFLADPEFGKPDETGRTPDDQWRQHRDHAIGQAEELLESVGARPDGGHNDDHDDGLGQWLTRTKSELTDAEQEQMWKDAEPVLEALLERTLAKRRRGSTLGDT